MTSTTRPRRRLYLGASAAALLLVVLVSSAAVWLRDQARRDQAEAVRDQAVAVSMRLDAWVDTIDYVLQVSADEIEHQSAGHGAESEAINRFLSRQQQRYAHIDLLRATNAQGEVTWGRGVDPAQRASLAQRDYFQRLRDDPSLGMVIAEPIIGRISQQWIWLMARRVNAPDGSFAGLVYASMFIRDLTRMLEQRSPPAGSFTTLRDAHQRVVASTLTGTAAPPAAASAASAPSVGWSAEAEARHLAELAEARRREPLEGSFVGSGPGVGDGPAVFSYRHNPTHGYTVLVGRTLAAADAVWHSQALALAGLLAALLLGLLYFVKATTRGWDQLALAGTLARRDRDHELLKSVIRGIPDLVWFKDAQGRYRACNAAFERYMGRNEPELLGLSDHDLVDHERADRLRLHDQQALDAGRPVGIEEWITYASDGRKALVLATRAPVRAPDGTIAGVLGIAHDITEQRQGEAALRDSQDQLNRANAGLEARVAERTAELLQANRELQDTLFAMEMVGIAIFWVDFETGRLIWVNRHAVEVLGYPREALLGMTVSDIDPNFPPHVYERAKSKVLAEGQARFETDYLTSDGRRLPMEMSIYFDHRDPQARPRLIAFSAGIAARKEAERSVLEAKAAAEAANRAKSAFLANMSHEIRTPLNALLGLSHLLRRDTLSPPQRERLDKMDSAGRHLLSIINDILDLSKVEAGRLQIETDNFHLSAVLDNVHSLLSDAAQAKGLRLEVDPDGVPLWLRGDATRLRQALLNFAGNAVKFTDQGHISMRALLIEDRGDDLLVRFEVQDTGPGLDEQQQARLFQPFEQVDGSSARRHGGTGLGLALNKRLIELMNGRIGVHSQPGAGSTFWFEVPLQRGHGPMPEQGPQPAHAGAEERLRRRHRGARVLLAEDNEINVEVVQQMLHAVGLDVVVARNGRVAVRHAQQSAFDLVLMDMQMPEMDGLDATRHIRAMAHHAATPILALTANAFTDDRQACLDAGMNGLLTKPVDPALLYDTVLQWLDRRAGRSAATDPAGPAPAPPEPDAAATLEHLGRADVVDLDGLRRRVPGGADRHLALLRRFVDLHRPDLAHLRDETAAGQHEAARQRLHRMRGAASLLGLSAVTAVASGLEVVLKDEPGPAAGVDAELDRLDQALQALVRALAPGLSRE